MWIPISPPTVPHPAPRLLHSACLALFLLFLSLSTGCDQDQDGDGWTAEQGDCDDAAPQVYPGAPELCNGTDDDCDSLIDVDDPSVTPFTWYPDGDGDGQGGANSPVQGCTAPEVYVAASGDCDDADPAVYIGALEVCDDQDNDCDQLADEEDPELSGGYVYLPDADQDGYGSTEDPALETCTEGAPEGYTSQEGDCADADPAVHPGAFEYPSDGLDNDCDGHAAAILETAAGSFHNLSVDDLGRVWAWGDNNEGELGDGTKYNRNAPVQVIGLPAAVAVSAGTSHSLALCEDGTIWAWGSNYYGQLGNGGAAGDSTKPLQVSGLGKVIAISAGNGHSLALLSDGTVSVWGLSVACGATADCTRPVPVAGLAQVTAIAGGGLHSLVLLADGSVKAWGSNAYGQLGDGTTTSRRTPVKVAGLSGVRGIAPGSEHSLALLATGTIQAWGHNDSGQLGDGTTTTRTSPVSVTGLANMQSISGGAWHSLASGADGTIWSWGWNRDGQLGDGTTTDRSNPVPVGGLDNASVVQAGSSHSLALCDDSTLWAWGDNGNGELGNGTYTSSSTPVQVATQGP